MKRIATLVAASIMAASSNAAVFNVTGILGEWDTKVFIPSTSTLYQEEFLLGNPLINVIGTITIDDSDVDPENWFVSALSLSQVGSMSATVSADSTTVMTISNLSWSLSGSIIDQTSGSASCAGGSIACASVASAISSNDATSPFQYDGVVKGFRVGGVRQITKDGFEATLDTLPTIYLDVFSDQPYAPNTSYNATHNMLFTLEATPVPVPAAAWLMGSGLVGLTAVARRRRG
jgi:hypothetical protein